jgi:hypothetical protein
MVVVLAEFFLDREMFQTKFVENMTAHILCSIIPPLPEYLAVYEIMWRNMVQPDGPQTTI